MNQVHHYGQMVTILYASFPNESSIKNEFILDTGFDEAENITVHKHIPEVTELTMIKAILPLWYKYVINKSIAANRNTLQQQLKSIF